MLSVLRGLGQDESKDVRAFAASALHPQSTVPTPGNVDGSKSDLVTTSAHHTFSRPPPPSAANSESILVDAPPIGFKSAQNWDECDDGEVLVSPKSSLKNGYDRESKAATAKTKDGTATRPGLSSRTKSDRASR